VSKEIEPMAEPGWYYKERIEYELQRLGARTWRYHDDPDKFKDARQAAPADVELVSEVYGAVLGPAEAVLDTLSHLNDNVGDDRIAEALFRQTPFQRR
jgi:hypothetical protein